MRITQHFIILLEGIVANPDQMVKTLPLMTVAERHDLLEVWNDTKTTELHDHCLHHLIEAQVERTPDVVAVVDQDRQLTYRDLNRRANQLAHYLKTLGVGPESMVGICVERSLEMIVGLLGILKAGGAYVPLDPAYPKERLAFMLRDSQVNVLLTQYRLVERLPDHKAKVFCLDTNWASMVRERMENLTLETTAEHLAYVIYTSGSTGKLKGAMNTHRGICNRLLWMQDTYQLMPDDRVVQKTPFSFDVSVWELFWPLLTGARLIMAQPGGHLDTQYLIGLIFVRSNRSGYRCHVLAMSA